PLHTPLVSFGEPGVYRFDDNGAHESGILYATLFTNGWGTNFAQWQPVEGLGQSGRRGRGTAGGRSNAARRHSTAVGEPASGSPGSGSAATRGGHYRFEFVMRPTGNDRHDGGLERGGAELFRPLIAAVVHGRPAQPAGSVLMVEPAQQVQLMTLKPAEFEPGLVMRLWNMRAEA